MCHSAPVQPFPSARAVVKACPITVTTIVSQTERPVESSDEPPVQDATVRLERGQYIRTGWQCTLLPYLVMPQKPRKATRPHVRRDGGMGTISGLIKWLVCTPLYPLSSTDSSWISLDAMEISGWQKIYGGGRVYPRGALISC